MRKETIRTFAEGPGNGVAEMLVAHDRQRERMKGALHTETQRVTEQVAAVERQLAGLARRERESGTRERLAQLHAERAAARAGLEEAKQEKTAISDRLTAAKRALAAAESVDRRESRVLVDAAKELLKGRLSAAHAEALLAEFSETLGQDIAKVIRCLGEVRRQELEVDRVMGIVAGRIKGLTETVARLDREIPQVEAALAQELSPFAAERKSLHAELDRLQGVQRRLQSQEIAFRQSPTPLVDMGIQSPELIGKS